MSNNAHSDFILTPPRPDEEKEDAFTDRSRSNQQSPVDDPTRRDIPEETCNNNTDRTPSPSKLTPPSTELRVTAEDVEFLRSSTARTTSSPPEAPSPQDELRRVTKQLRALGHLVKAGCLLKSEPRQVDFEHEEEQRLVYALVYDAFRYRSVFNQALQDTNFFTTFPQQQKELMLIHLLLCQLQRRRFGSRESPIDWPTTALVLKKEWISIGMDQIEDALWQMRVRLAAALARLRIGKNALRLEQLLPIALQDHQSEEEPELAAAWVNTFQTSVEEVISLLKEADLQEVSSGTQNLGKREFCQDSRCPGLLLFHPSLRAELAQASLVTRGLVVLQGRAFCLGPGEFCRILEELSLYGTVVQTHVSSPRTTAYLAALLASRVEPRKLVSFGLGTKKSELESYLEWLGAVNVKVHSERFVELSPDSPLLDEVVAVIALPPNSYSAIRDPVELACSSEGGLSVLEELTLAAEGGSEQFKRHQDSLQQEQHETLRLALSAPQIQLVLFESHSAASEETRDLLLSELDTANEAARQRAYVSSYARARASSAAPQEDPDAPLLPDLVGEEPSQLSEESMMNTGTHESLATPTSTISCPIPPTDLYEIAPLETSVPRTTLIEQGFLQTNPDEVQVPVEVDPCPALQESGCFLALLRRQEITRLDAQYMIQIAESRGLFGANNKKKSASASSKKTPRKKTPDLKALLNQGKQRIRDQERGATEIDRISAPTVASLLRQSVPPSIVSTNSGGGGGEGSIVSCPDCPRHARAIEPPPDLCSRYYFARQQDARRWWREAAQRILALLRMTNPGSLPRFRLVRTPLPGPGASCRLVYPVHVCKTAFPSGVSEADEDEGDQDGLRTPAPSLSPRYCAKYCEDGTSIIFDPTTMCSYRF